MKNRLKVKLPPDLNPEKTQGTEIKNRQPTGERERNVGHPNGEEHSRRPKGNQGIHKFVEDVGNAAVVIGCSVAIIIVIADDSVGFVFDDAAVAVLAPLIWDSSQALCN